MTTTPTREPQRAPAVERESTAPDGATAVPSAPVPLPTGAGLHRPHPDADDVAAGPLERLRTAATPLDAQVRRSADAAQVGGIIRRDGTGAAVASSATTSAPTPTPSPTSSSDAVETLVEPLGIGAVGPVKVPGTLTDLLACNDAAIDDLLDQTNAGGPLMTILKGPFESDWFKAKACLAFDTWPGARPRFSHATALKLMTAFTVMRGKVHDKAMKAAKATMDDQLKARAKKLAEGSKLRTTLESQSTKAPTLPGTVTSPDAPPAHVDYKGSVGADSVTSDVDVSTGGLNSEVAVRAYNEAFRDIVGGEYDPGTVFDLNVYAMDFIHGRTDSEDKLSFTVKTENKEKPTAEDAASRDREQDIWALVHVARYMPKDADWNAFVRDSLQGIVKEDVRADQEDRLRTARRRALAFEERLVSLMADLADDLEFGEEALKKSSWDDHTNLHHLQGALRMRAANQIYEDKLLQVKQLRAEIAALREGVEKKLSTADPTRLAHLVSKLDGELSMAQLYANEVYGSGGGTVHAVMGMQTKNKLTEERGHAVKAIIPKQQWFQTFTDNLGDVLKDFEHFGRQHFNLYEEETAAEIAAEAEAAPTPGSTHKSAPKRAAPVHPPAHPPVPEHEHTPDYWYAAFKMGKYADRMVDALPYLHDGGQDDLITGGDALELGTDPKVTALRELATKHKAEKSGAAKNDPLVLRTHSYFGAMTKDKVEKLRKDAIDLGVLVRKMVATTAAAQPVPAKLPGAEAPAPKPTPGKLAPTTEQQAAAGEAVTRHLAKMAAAAQQARAASERLSSAPEASSAPQPASHPVS